MNHPTAQLPKHNQQGMVLLAVLWSVMALSIIVMGLSKSLKTEIRQVATDKESVQLAALGDAAVLYVLKQLVASRATATTANVATQVHLWGQMVEVEVQPLNGLIDLNTASVQLLSDLLQHAGGLTSDQSHKLAQAIQMARSRDGGTGRPEGFDSVEDLLRVPGLSRRLFARIELLVSAHGSGSGKVNPLAAPIGVLRVLAGGNSVAASAFLARRQSLDAASHFQLDTTMFNAAHTEVVASTMLMLTARMPLGNNRTFARVWKVKLVPPEPGALPWQRLDVTQRLLPSAAAIGGTS